MHLTIRIERWRRMSGFATLACFAAAVVPACRPPAVARVAPDRVAEAQAEAMQAIANERSIAVASIPSRSVGITPFAVNTGDTAVAPLAYGLADILITDLQR